MAPKRRTTTPIGLKMSPIKKARRRTAAPSALAGGSGTQTKPWEPVGFDKSAAPATTPEQEEVKRLQRAAGALRPSPVQGKLPCREEEQEDIRKHLHSSVRLGGTVQVLYVSGMPGTGKTGSVLHLLDGLKQTAGLPAFHLVHINAMRLVSPSAVFSNIRSQLPPGRSGPVTGTATSAPRDVEHFFETRRASDPVVVLLVDEIDHLATKSQSILYRVFDLLQLPKPKLVVVAISNTMDLPERMLPRVASRFSIVRVEFQPYTREQIIEIISQRLADVQAAGVLDPVVLKLCAARVAAGSGDIRKALQCFRRAIEVRLATPAATGPVAMEHLNVAESDLLRASPATNHIPRLGLLARRFLTALLLELRKARTEAVPVAEVTTRYAKLAVATAQTSATASFHQEATLGGLRFQDEAQFLVKKLEAMALVVQTLLGTGSQSERALLLGCGMDTEDLAAALEPAEQDPGLRDLIRDAGSR